MVSLILLSSKTIDSAISCRFQNFIIESMIIEDINRCTKSFNIINIKLSYLIWRLFFEDGAVVLMPICEHLSKYWFRLWYLFISNAYYWSSNFTLFKEL